jgi:hypothetical protein
MIHGSIGNVPKWVLIESMFAFAQSLAWFVDLIVRIGRMAVANRLPCPRPRILGEGARLCCKLGQGIGVGS